MASAQTLRMEAEIRRRKVRKGTHSCWECRRRKIKCQYDSSSDTVCLPCQARGSQCQSQEYVDESKTIPPPDRRLAQRLGRLEEMMEKLMDHIKPENSAAGSSMSRTASASPSPPLDDSQEQVVDVFDGSINEDTPLGILLGIHSATPAASQPSKTLSTPDSENAAPDLSAKARSHSYDEISKSLHALFPAQSDIDTIIKGTGGTYFVTTLFHHHRDVVAGNCESQSDLCTVPPVNAHPTVLARRLLQLCICMQQLSPVFNRAELTVRTTLSKVMARITCTVATLVTYNDKLIGTSEGLQCLGLQAIWHANAGNLRKAWLSNRKALSLAQLMGIDRGNTRAFKSADRTSDPRKHASAAGVYYRIVYTDRFISLLLGLPIGTYDNSFATEEAMLHDEPRERLNKAHTVISARIIERNSNKTAQAYTMTQEIDFEIEKAAQSVAADWWQEPILDPFASHSRMSELVCTFIHQIHHFDLLILLHLPYMLRDPAESRYEYSRVTCTRASREVLKRFVGFRTIINSAFSCRHVDYSALIAAMTLLLSYLGTQKLDSTGNIPHNNVPIWPPSSLASCPPNPNALPICTIHEDRKLIEAVRERMRHVAIINDDKLSQESADIISQLMPVLEMRDKGNESAALDCLHLSVPYLGTVSIRPNESHSVNMDATGNGSMAPYQITIPHAGLAPGGMAPMEQMDLSGLEHVFMGGNDGGGGMSLPPFDPQMLPDAEFPALTAEADDWTLQGVDTSFWSMLNGGL
ncbi:hypothetical protein CONLIGDRAFT_411750 [Coniochaeta ligniaria NRRL 30616]|uniref:Zn(2)-C6 fungal-type domain-containing protein n=1 Tax=Coniochaeta ligniaria NRRL 30616 TaxID=1408157 RepID=A0A1J7JHL4_9PEZI|nr:hypothetical protein CONLIGDRAFT_411750 [Coniochaeta ligniaria NRRL 30616]